MGIKPRYTASIYYQEKKTSSSRIITDRFDSKVRKISVVVCYVHIEDTNKIPKERFYDTLGETLNKIKKQDIKILHQPKLGLDNSGYTMRILDE